MVTFFHSFWILRSYEKRVNCNWLFIHKYFVRESVMIIIIVTPIIFDYVTFFSTPFNLSITVKWKLSINFGKCIGLMGIERTTIYCCYRNFYKYFRLSGLNFSQHLLGCNFRILPVRTVNITRLALFGVSLQLVLTEIITFFRLTTV